MNPKVLGELKLQGYSNYLHPYDKNHLIGIGRETKEVRYGNMQVFGVKVTLFDVSDVYNHRLVDMYEIGGPRTESEVLYDHRALLFDKNKDVLSIPLSIYPDYTELRFTSDGRHLESKVWRGFYVFGIDPAAGLNLMGQIDHFSDNADRYYYGYVVQGSRSLYIGNVLYTVTVSNATNMSVLQTLEEINKLEIDRTEGIIRYQSFSDANTR